jgi:murein DD-endopeptidase MepM/ murein hydrolase activator NlpD
MDSGVRTVDSVRRTAWIRLVLLVVLSSAVSALLLGALGRAAAASETGAKVTPRATWAPPLPAPLRVVRPFRAPANRYAPGHRGVDLAGSAGTAVRAPGPGRVRFAGRLIHRGVVSVDSGGFRFSYEPVRPLVRAGQQVSAGTLLGLLEPGHPGCSVCLHWGVRLGERYLDPMSGLATRIRLLPLDGVPVGSAARVRRRDGLLGGGVPVTLPVAAGLGLAVLALRR